MCDRSDQLIAWLDCELTEREAAELERHIQECAECRMLVEAYKKVSQSLEAYCDAAMESGTRRAQPPRWASVLIAAAAAIVLLLLYPRDHAARLPSETPQAATFHPTVLEAPLKAPLRAMPARKGRQVRKRYSASPPNRDANWVPTEPIVQIAIPAEAMFAPGALPQGVSFAAELRLAADGSAQQLRLQP